MISLPANMPENAKSAYAAYLGEDPKSREKLLQQITDYIETVTLATVDHEFVDNYTAKAIAEGLTALLKEEPDEHLPYIQATITYFIAGDDATPDLDTVLGFDDDMEVFNAVCRHLGKTELEIHYNSSGNS